MLNRLFKAYELAATRMFEQKAHGQSRDGALDNSERIDFQLHVARHRVRVANERPLWVASSQSAFGQKRTYAGGCFLKTA
jgi:hypothetical protein